MDWIQIAEEFVGRYGWGARGKYIGVSRMISDSDVPMLSKGKYVISMRPRGILSGFLAIVPQLGYAVYLPPVASRITPFRMRVRMSDECLEKGVIVSCYIPNMSEKRIVVEDCLMWLGTSMWFTQSFEERWKCLQLLSTVHICPDLELQGYTLDYTRYQMLDTLEEPDDHSVVEFVPIIPNAKRMIWSPHMQPRVTHTVTPVSTATNNMLVKREAALGPDVYSVWKDDSRLGIALIRTLAVSRALRLSNMDTIRVVAFHNKQFEKYEVTEVIA